MNRLLTGLVAAALVASALGLTAADNAEAATTGTVNFGMDASSIGRQTSAGAKPDYGTIWVGPWTLKHGWAGTDAELQRMSNQGVVPAIHLYYWGDDISKSCIENGCYSSLHGSWKDKAGWNRLTNELINHLNAKMQGKTVVIFLETEFNKADVQTYEPLDYYLKVKADQLHRGYPNAKVVLALGTWNTGAWSTWDRAGAASDMIGIQGMRGSTHETMTQYMGLYEATLAGAKKAQSVFGKPIIIHDIALSTYPEPTYVRPQADALKEFFTGMAALKAAGVKGIIYRSWNDNPNFDINNYYGKAERHWGLAYATNAPKSSAHVWVAGVKAERGNTGSSAPAPSTSTTSMRFTPTSVGNEWWVDVKVDSSSGVSRVSARVDGGAWTSLPKTSWGTYAKSIHVPKGSSVSFWAVDSGGRSAYSPAFAWGEAATTFKAGFEPRSLGNEWWVDVAVDASKPLGKVNARVNDGAWTTLSKTSWGTYAKSIHVPKGSTVTFQAIDTNGGKATSTAYAWGASFSASFAPRQQGNDWWIETGVSAKGTVQKVEVKVGGGAWTVLPKTSWGTYAKSVHAPNGSNVVFRATDTNGATDLSATYKWY